MALELGTLLAERIQLGHGEEAHSGQTGVLNGADMAFGEDHAVTVRPAGILGVQVHVLEVAGGNEVRRGERAAGVAGLGLVNHIDHVHAHPCGSVFQFLDGYLFHNDHLMFSVSWFSMPGTLCSMSDK